MGKVISVPESALYYNKNVLAYVKDGDIHYNTPNGGVLVESSSDLDVLTGCEPGTLAFTSGFVDVWMKNIGTGWTKMK